MDKNKKNQDNQKLWKTLGSNIVIWVLIIIMAISALQYFSTDYKPKTITYSEFQGYVSSGKVESGKIVGRTFTGKFKDPLIIENASLNAVKEYIPNANWEAKTPWYDKFIADQKEILYLRNLIASKENLKDKARIWLSTIHAIKGGEEDNVILSLHQGRTVQQGIKSSVDKQDEEHRVWYVGVTRARNNLYKLRAKKKLREYQL